MARRRLRLLAGGAAVAVVALAATVTLVHRPVTIPTVGPWVVLVGTGKGDLASCLDDPAVDFDLMAAVMPPVGLSIYLVDDATRADAERVVRCLAAEVAPSAIRVITASD